MTASTLTGPATPGRAVPRPTDPRTADPRTAGTPTDGTVPAPRTADGRRRRIRPRPPEPPPWSCENCQQPNAGRRRRCADCGTSHY